MFFATRPDAFIFPRLRLPARARLRYLFVSECAAANKCHVAAQMGPTKLSFNFIRFIGMKCCIIVRGGLVTIGFVLISVSKLDI